MTVSNELESQFSADQLHNSIQPSNRRQTQDHSITNLQSTTLEQQTHSPY